MIKIQEKPLPISKLEEYPDVHKKVFDDLENQLKLFSKKIVVLDDDPTGVQTVHGVPVYTDWKADTLRDAFHEKGSMFFVLTNSRSMTPEQTIEVHKEIANTLFIVSQEANKEFILISRSDSTLRGHFPHETLALKKTLEDAGHPAFDGEIIFPFFLEGGRFTIDNTHYAQEGTQLTPASKTEFAKDKLFGYQHSYLPNWCEEKTDGIYHAENAVCISLDDLRSLQIDKTANQLYGVHDFGKVVVNSIAYEDVAVFILAFLKALERGKHFIFRSAAAVTKILGGIPDQPLLTRERLIVSGMAAGGIVLIGSHVKKTTEQLNTLLRADLPLSCIEFDVRKTLREDVLKKEILKITDEMNMKIQQGHTVVLYTSREFFDISSSARISEAITSIVSGLAVRPSFIIAKGGITSSDVGTKALGVRRALVLGQAAPGVPVWLTGPESKFPNMPYIIFPGNVGSDDTLYQIVSSLM